MIIKKGEMKSATTLILFVVVFFSVTLIFSKGVGFADERTTDELCRLSVLARINTQGLTGTSPIALDCPRKNVVLFDEGSKFYHSGELNVDMKKLPINQFSDPENSPTEKRKLMKYFADEYAECWYKMGEGDMKVFNPPSGYPFEGFETTCIICSDISFDQSYSGDMFTLNEFEDFMKTEKYTKHGKEELYRDYLYQDFSGFRNVASYLYTFNTYFDLKGQKAIQQSVLDPTAKLEKNQSYIIFFERAKFNPTAAAFSSFVFPGVGTVVGTKLLLSPSEENYFVFFAPAKKLPDVCGVMVN